MMRFHVVIDSACLSVLYSVVQKMQTPFESQGCPLFWTTLYTVLWIQAYASLHRQYVGSHTEYVSKRSTEKLKRVVNKPLKMKIRPSDGRSKTASTLSNSSGTPCQNSLSGDGGLTSTTWWVWSREPSRQNHWCTSHSHTLTHVHYRSFSLSHSHSHFLNGSLIFTALHGMQSRYGDEKAVRQCEIGCQLLLITNRKSHTGFWLVPTSITWMTLNAVVLCVFFTDFDRVSGRFYHSGWR